MEFKLFAHGGEKGEIIHWDNPGKTLGYLFISFCLAAGITTAIHTIFWLKNKNKSHINEKIHK